MTSKEAWEQIKNFIFELRKEKYIAYKTYTDIIKKLVERDTPMIPISESIELICPKCREEQHTNTAKFCSECGQRLYKGDLIGAIDKIVSKSETLTQWHKDYELEIQNYQTTLERCQYLNKLLKELENE